MELNPVTTTQSQAQNNNKTELARLIIEVGASPIAFVVAPPHLHEIFGFQDKIRRLSYLKLIYDIKQN